MKKSVSKVVVLVVVASISLFLAGCTRPEQARRVLQQAGYSNIEITGWRPFMAGEDDAYSTGFRAISPSGHRVSGAVTSGLLKGSTIRVD